MQLPHSVTTIGTAVGIYGLLFVGVYFFGYGIEKLVSRLKRRYKTKTHIEILHTATTEPECKKDK